MLSSSDELNKFLNSDKEIKDFNPPKAIIYSLIMFLLFVALYQLENDIGSAKTDKRMNGISKNVGISQRDLYTLKNSEPHNETGQPAPSKEGI